jgi:hypothetical protein
MTFEGAAYINDHLRQEFSERVSKKRKLLLYTRLSDALTHFEVAVSPQEVAAEQELVESTAEVLPGAGPLMEVHQGPLKGVIGRLLSKGPSGRLLLMVDIIGQSVRIELDPADVRPYAA